MFLAIIKEKELSLSIIVLSSLGFIEQLEQEKKNNYHWSQSNCGPGQKKINLFWFWERNTEKIKPKSILAFATKYFLFSYMLQQCWNVSHENDVAYNSADVCL